MANSAKLVDLLKKLQRCKQLVIKWRIMASKMSTGDVARFRLRQCAKELEEVLRGGASQE